VTIPTNAVSSYNNVGNREDLEDVIYRVAPEDVPFQSSIGVVKATATFHEWQTESLATADPDNAQVEGDDVASLDAGNIPTRLGNYAQIFRKTGGVSRTEEIVDKAGRESEMDRQKILKGKEMKRDMEARFMQNKASVAGNGTTARKSAGALAWCVSNTSTGSGGTNGSFASNIQSAATNGTQRTFTEALLKAVLATAFNNGGKPSQAYVGATHKQQFSSFTGIADIRSEVKGREQAVIVAAADVYVSDFGAISVIPHAYGLGASARDCLLITPDMFKVGTLDGVKSSALAKTGDSERFMMTAEKTLVCANEKAHAAIRDLT
jgi:hypothetical protein